MPIHNFDSKTMTNYYIIVGISYETNGNIAKKITEISKYIGETTNNIAEYSAIIEALKKGDIDGAVECCVLKENKETMREKLNRVKEKGMFDLMLKDISTIQEEKESTSNSGAVYLFESIVKGETFKNSMSFQKNLQGVWLIESF